MRAMIFAAGLGTRLKPLTDALPKALVPVCGRPLLDYVLEKVFAVQGPSGSGSMIDRAVVNVHHFADKIESYVAGRPDLSAKVAFSDERECLLETGGAILHARLLLEGGGSFIVHNVDILSDADLSWLAAAHQADSVATLLVSGRRTSRYLLFDSQDMRLKGWMNESTGEIRSPFPDLRPESCQKLAFSGIHVMSDSIFDLMQAYADEHSLRFPVMDFYLSICREFPIYGVAADSLTMIDVGKLDTLASAEAFVKSQFI